MTVSPSARAVQQYATTSANLTARMALHAYGTNPQDWFTFVAARLPAGGDVLEVGAGTGALWSRVDRRGMRLTLTDFSAAMCDRLREVDDATVQRCDATRLPFAAGSFDTLIGNHMLYHLDDPRAALREFARVLRPGGRVFVAVNGRDHHTEITALGPAVGRPDLTLSAVHNDVTAETVPQWMARHFDAVTVERYPGDLAVPSPEPVLAFLASVAAEPLTPAERSAARDLVAARIAADGVFRVRRHTVLISAQKTRQ
ncbi:class I SAM-dependent methyltransferase [Actinoplanes sp. CA-252034]|uniref:class I SAM-dependent methyltransferase n=1 Tax=Actinoplanes sp. CA-252034 TaxID=3239906 RepID=UPI003D95E5B2